MRERRTVRLLLLDGDNLCLMKVADKAVGDGLPKWVTLGGRMEAGETVFMTAAREAAEETGQRDGEIGPVVWYGEQVLSVRGELVQFKESFVVVRAKSKKLDNAGWTGEERAVVSEMRWWSLVEMQTTHELLLPRSLPDLLPPILAGLYPQEPMRITL